MTAYVLADIDVTDPARYEDYKALASAAARAIVDERYSAE
jgi:uncharacterized protein (DUF1330 family)